MSNSSIIIICISLEQSQKRRQQIEVEIDRLKGLCPDMDINFEFFDAIYGKSLAPEYLSFINIASFQAKQCEKVLSAGEIGCMLSHMFIWQRQVDGLYDQYDRVIIIEDDIYLNTNKLNEKLTEIACSNEPFLFLGGHSLVARRRIIGYPSPSRLSFIMLGSHYQYSMACAYSMTKGEAKSLLYKLVQKPTYVDNWKYLLKSHGKIPFYFCFEQGGKDDSTIGNARAISTVYRKEYRLLKNFKKIKDDFLTYLKALLIFKRCGKLVTYLKKENEDFYR